MDVPKVEMQLAKLVQNAKGRGLKWTKNMLYKDDYGKYTTPAKASYCCALGAASLARDTKGFSISTYANDHGVTGTFAPNEVLDSSVLLGLGFRLAMK